jgi:all-trans-retinol 13,14-reductase
MWYPVKFPNIREDSIQSIYTCTPLTFKDYMGTNDGSIYGIVKDCNAPITKYDFVED